MNSMTLSSLSTVILPNGKEILSYGVRMNGNKKEALVKLPTGWKWSEFTETMLPKEIGFCQCDVGPKTPIYGIRNTETKGGLLVNRKLVQVQVQSLGSLMWINMYENEVTLF